MSSFCATSHGVRKIFAVIFSSLIFALALVGSSSGNAFGQTIRDLQTEVASEGRLHYHYPARFQPVIKHLRDLGSPQLQKLEETLGIDAMPTVDVWVLSDLNHFFDHQGLDHRAPPWAVGLSLSNQRTILLLHGTSQSGQIVDVPRTFAHELAHVAMDVARGGYRVPRWFNEGFAILHADEWTFERMDVFVRATSLRSVIPLKNLDASFPPQHHTVSIAYAQSYHFVRMLQDSFGDDVYARTLKFVREGIPFPTALERVTGHTLDDLETLWLEQLQASASLWTFLGDETTVFFGVTLIFLVVVVTRLIRKHRQLRLMDHDDPHPEWDYEVSRYPLPGDNYQK